MAVDAVVRHWVEVMVDGAGGQGGNGQEYRHQNELFYADENMIELSDPGWLQGEFSTLVRLFDWVGLRGKVGKTVGMVCRPCQAEVTQSEAAYKRWMTGTVPSYLERQRVQV